MNIIETGRKVTMHFTIYLEDNSVADSTKVNGLPGTLVIGDGTLMPEFEKHLLGLKPGDKTQFTAPATEAFGETNPQHIYILPVAQFPADMLLEPGAIIEFTQPNGHIWPGVVRQINAEGVTVDFNHPLAGQTIRFEAEIIAVE